MSYAEYMDRRCITDYDGCERNLKRTRGYFLPEIYFLQTFIYKKISFGRYKVSSYC